MVFVLICKKLLILLNISCYQSLNIMAYVVSQVNGLNPTSLTENNFFSLMVTTMTQSHHQLINCLSLPIELSPMVKNSIIISAITCWNKNQNMLGDQSL